MKSMKKRNLRLGIFCAVCLNVWVLHAKTPQAMAKLTVRVYDFAGVPDGMLAPAEQMAAWIFHGSGIELRWLECRVLHEQIDKLQVCTTIQDSPTAIVKILPHSMAERSGIPEEKLGGTAPPNQAFIYFDRVQKLSQDRKFFTPSFSAASLPMHSDTFCCNTKIIPFTAS